MGDLVRDLTGDLVRDLMGDLMGVLMVDLVVDLMEDLMGALMTDSMRFDIITVLAHDESRFTIVAPRISTDLVFCLCTFSSPLFWVE